MQRFRDTLKRSLPYSNRRFITVLLVILLSTTFLGASSVGLFKIIGNGEELSNHTSIQDAINEAVTCQISYDRFRIVTSGYFYENILISNLDKELVIDGNNSTIDGRFLDSVVIIDSSYAVTLNNLNIINGYATRTILTEQILLLWHAHGVNGPGYYNHSYSTPVYNPGGGVMINQVGSVTIHECSIENNKARYGGGIFSYFCNDLKVHNSLVHNNHSTNELPSNGAALCIYATNLEIFNSRIFNHLSNPIFTLVSLRAYRENVMWQAHFKNSLIVDNDADISLIDFYGVGRAGDLSDRVTFTHCTISNNITDNPDPIRVYGFDNMYDRTVVAKFYNNIIIDNGQTVPFSPPCRQIWGNNVNFTFWNNIIPNHSEQFTPEFDQYDVISIEYSDNLDEDPLMDDNYELTWGIGTKSPCINSGYRGENCELTDPDGTPPDIGALYYPHSAKTYSFERNDGQYIYWMSFPVVDDRTKNNAIYWNELQHLFYDHTSDPLGIQLNTIDWYYNGESGKMRLDGVPPQWTERDYQATQPKGFKVQFNNVQISPITVYGFKADPAITPIEVMPLVDNSAIENWIGYFVPYTQKVMDAFSRTLPGTNKTYLDHIYSIKTQRWCINRVAYEYESSWAIPPDTYTLSEGDMVAILLLPNAPNELFWSALSVATPVIRPEPQFFSYTEKLDYTPVFIEFDPTDLPSEVGIFVNGVCMGASVVDTTIVDVCFYLEDSKSDDDIEINFYYEGKGKRKAEGFTVYNPHRQIFEKKTLSTGIIDKSIFISYSKGDGVPNAPMHTSLSANYPNPFNPQTTISFTLGKAMPAKVEIYNVKGQRVKTLVDDKLPIGRHQYIWNGRDNNQQSVASGVYFARLKTTEGTHVQKMMLLK